MKRVVFAHLILLFLLSLLTGCAAWTLPEGNAPKDLTGPSEVSRMSPEAAESAMASALTRFVLMRGLAPAEFAIQPENTEELRFFVSLDRNLFIRASDPGKVRFLLVSIRSDRAWKLQLKERESDKILWQKKLEW